MSLLAVLLLVVYGYWYMTNDRRVRDQAEQYLTGATGWRVRIQHAHFSLFSGIALDQVRMYAPNSDAAPVFQAQRVWMRHRPWDLLAGDLKPLEIICDRPVVTIEAEAGTDLSQNGTFRTLSQKNHNPGRGEWTADLPPIRVRKGSLRIIPKTPGLPAAPLETPLNLSMTQAQRGVYHIVFERLREGEEPSMMGSLDFDLASSATSNVTGETPRIENIYSSLPGPYRAWLERYAVHGARAKIHQLAGGPKGHWGVYEVEMANLALKLPPEQGGAELDGVAGKMTFDDVGVTIDLTGHVVQAGHGEFTLSGRYGGYELGSPFDFKIETTDATMPRSGTITGSTGEFLDDLIRTYQPQGKFSLSMEIHRGSDGKVTLAGTAHPKAMAAQCRYFPYAVQNVSGTVNFTQSRVELNSLTAQRGATRFVITGEVAPQTGIYDVRIAGQQVELDEALQQAMPKSFQENWRQLDPRGKASGTVRAYKVDEERGGQIAIKITLDGQASLCYGEFPYRLESLLGEVRVEDDDVFIDSLQGRRGKMNCTINGSILATGTPTTDSTLVITAREMAMDKDLKAALSPAGRARLDDLHVQGELERLTVTLRQRPGEKMTYKIVAIPTGLSFNVDSFPYGVTDARGTVVVDGDRVTIEKLQGRHGASTIDISGQVPLNEKDGLDMVVRGKNIEFDKDLLAALPPAAQKTWRKISPVGAADVEVLYRKNMPQMTSESSYDITLTTKDMQLRYVDFPYAFEHVSGQARIQPDRITLENFRSERGDMRASLSGTIRSGVSGDTADLKVHATSMPVDAALLAALPKTAIPLISCVKPGGTFDVQFDNLRIDVPPSADVPGGAASTPASAAAGAPSVGAPSAGRSPAGSEPARVAATQPQTSWQADGVVSFKSAVMDVGFGDRIVTGNIKGTASTLGGGLQIAADASLDSIQIGGNAISNLQAQIRKAPTSHSIRVSDLSAKLLGGRLAGSADIRLGDAIECGVQLEVNDIRLADLLAAQQKGGAAADQIKAEGLIAGNIGLRARVGDVASQQAVGELWLSKAKITQMPVMLGVNKVMMVFLPGNATFNDGLMRYQLRGNTLIFDEICLNGSTMSILGSGQVDIKTEKLVMNFLSKPGGTLPRLASLDVLVESLMRELNEVHVTGTLGKPIVRSTPLRSLDEMMRRLTTPGSEGR